MTTKLAAPTVLRKIIRPQSRRSSRPSRGQPLGRLDVRRLPMLKRPRISALQRIGRGDPAVIAEVKKGQSQ